MPDDCGLLSTLTLQIIMERVRRHGDRTKENNYLLPSRHTYKYWCVLGVVSDCSWHMNKSGEHSSGLQFSECSECGGPITPTGRDIQPGQTLISSSSCYSIVEFIGEGCFGRVAKCKNLSTDEIVALKIKKDIAYVQDKEKEVFMLNVIGILNSDHTNIVTFFERFEYMGQICLAFEMLDGHLYQLLEQRGWKPMAINEIRPIAKQACSCDQCIMESIIFCSAYLILLLGALDALKGLGVMHTDIKPDNIMLVNRHDQPLRVKLIDFGAALLASDVQLGMDIQPLGYRAPEVALGLPFTEAVDVWGVGCVLAYLYLTDNLFPVDCEYQITPEEYTAANNMKPVEQRNSLIELPSSLDALVHVRTLCCVKRVNIESVPVIHLSLRECGRHRTDAINTWLQITVRNRLALQLHTLH
ncbi:hypothetical protein F2P81_011985 [Scophthalmus maximus]|uniref:Protein kinase domain-containing protein n=1 Tax=Scophthalmus maximus TaxID=52904 RepID=A0A6A4SRQ3_SCOMX|nr:hypothetical protein F2P81_011985 [Scophthalmus maximus]